MTRGFETPVAFRYREYRLFQADRFLATIATQMQSVVVGWEVYDITRQPLALGYVGLVQFLPAAGLSLLTGHTADRVDRRKILLFCHVGLVACSLLLYARGAAAGPTATSALPIYAILLLFGITRAFLGPASQALMPSLVPTEHFASAVAWGSSIWEVAAIAGPALGGVAYGLLHGARNVYLLCAVLYGAGTLFLDAMRPRTERMDTRAVSLETLLAGIAYVWQKKLILGSISLDLFAVLFGGATALLPVYARDILHVGPTGLGILRSAPAVGAALTALVIAQRPLRRRAGAIMFACVALFGVATIVFGVSRSFWLSLVALAVIGASDMVSVVVRSTLVQLETPAAMRGRVSAVNMVFIGASNELGEMESGLTAAWFGAVPAVVIGGVGACAVVLLWTFLFPDLRRVDRLELPQPAPSPPAPNAPPEAPPA
jgi:MFS family permease